MTITSENYLKYACKEITKLSSLNGNNEDDAKDCIETFLTHLQEIMLQGENIPHEMFEFTRNHEMILAFVIIILEGDNLDTCLNSIDILFILTSKSAFYQEAEKGQLAKYFTNPTRYCQVYRTMKKVHEQISQGAKRKDTHLKLLKILEALSSKKPRYQFSELSEEDIEYCIFLIVEYQDSKSHVEVLLNLMKLMCRNKKFCKFLGRKELFDILYDVAMLTQQSDTVARIIRCLGKNPDILEEMKSSIKFCSLILTLVNSYIKKVMLKKHLITTFYRITKDCPNILSAPPIWNGLCYFVKNFHHKNSDKRLKMSAIKCYTLLNLGIERRLMPCLFMVKLNIPEETYLKLNKLSTIDSDSDENSDDEVDEGDINNNNHDSESSDDEYEYLMGCSEKYFESVIPHLKTSVTCMAKFFDPDGQTTSNSLWIFEEMKAKLDDSPVSSTNLTRKLLFDSMNKSEAVCYLAYPDFVDISHALNETVSYVKEFPLPDLEEKIQNLKENLHVEFPSKFIFSAMNIEHCYMFRSFQNNYCDIKPGTLNSIDCNGNYDEIQHNRLIFNSRFESGNLNLAEQIAEYEYNLYLTPDTNHTNRQWFYFEVSNTISGKDYVFNIVNLEKINSQFNCGMQPVLFSTMTYLLQNLGWRRTGDKIIYYGNNFTTGDRSKQYRTLSFHVVFEYSYDYCYIAYHYPYTYTKLMDSLLDSYTRNSSIDSIYLRIDNLCFTINNNYVPLVTITSCAPKPKIRFEDRSLVFLTARVHPGESNSSWIMDGILKFLLLEDDIFAITARENYIFKIIPMLNPDGCIFGNTRTGLAGCDLNRCWKHPDKQLHPEIYYTKKLVHFAKTSGKHTIKAFIDIHGHSRKKYYFFYGCDPTSSWNIDDLNSKSPNCDEIPAEISFDSNMKKSYCHYRIEKKKETTCRMVMWREFSIQNSLTLECSYCSGDNKKKMTTSMLQDIGKNLIIALAKLSIRSHDE